MSRQSNEPLTIELYLNQLMDHLRVNFSMIRMMVEEEQDAEKTATAARRRYPRTGTFRKRLSGADWVLFENLKVAYAPLRKLEEQTVTSATPTLADFISRPGGKT